MQGGKAGLKRWSLERLPTDVHSKRLGNVRGVLSDPDQAFRGSSHLRQRISDGQC